MSKKKSRSKQKRNVRKIHKDMTNVELVQTHLTRTGTQAFVETLLDSSDIETDIENTRKFFNDITEEIELNLNANNMDRDIELDDVIESLSNTYILDPDSKKKLMSVRKKIFQDYGGDTNKWINSHNDSEDYDDEEENNSNSNSNNNSNNIENENIDLDDSDLDDEDFVDDNNIEHKKNENKSSKKSEIKHLKERIGKELSLKTFCDACRRGDTKACELFLRIYAKKNLKKSKEFDDNLGLFASSQPLKHAIRSQSNDCVSFLLNKGFSHDDDHLIIAAKFSTFEIVKTLIDFGLDVNFGYNDTALAFPVSKIKLSIERILNGGFTVTLRSRLVCEIHRNGENNGNEKNQIHPRRRRDSTMSNLNSSNSLLDMKKKPDSYQVLNEVVIDRGPSSSIVQLQMFSGRNSKEPVTIVQGDGIIVSTPTGSTAYSLAAGGSAVHPAVPAMCITPISPHSLSFRPILIPDSSHLKLKVPMDARTTAWASFDGRDSVELKKGDYATISVSQFPIPAIEYTTESDEWLNSLRDALHWNLRITQKPFENRDKSYENLSKIQDEWSADDLKRQNKL
jgi:NAD kinase